jgi:anti-sigma B factor antagonist
MVRSHDDHSTPPSDRNPPFLVVDTVEDADGVTVQVGGELDILTIPQLATHLQRCLAACAPSTALVVDLSEVSFLAAAGSATLIAAAQNVEDRGCRFAVIGCRPIVLRVLDVLGVRERLNATAAPCTTR